MSVCELCSTDTEVARGPVGSTAKSWTTKNLLNHLETHHKSELAAEKTVHEKERLTLIFFISNFSQIYHIVKHKKT